MKILFITSSRIGDAVLSTGLLDHIAKTWPTARVTIACGPLATSLFEGYPHLDRIIPLQKKSHNRHWIDLWLRCIGTRWDMVVDLRDSAVSRLVLAKKRYIFGSHINNKKHKVEQNAQVMGLSSVPSPKLWFTAKQRDEAEKLIPSGGPVLGVGPAANWQGKTWPSENFIEVVKFIAAPNGLMPNARVAVFGAPGEEKECLKVLQSVPSDKQIDAIAKGNPGAAAAGVARCDFFIGNDSGLMHCAAASNVPTLGLFGPSYPHLYRPWGQDYVSTPQSYDELIDYPGYDPKTAPCLMTTLTVDAVREKLERFRSQLKKSA
jgi:lipopolysaccharide export system permease protein